MEVDPKLLAIARAAEEGQRCPALKLATASQYITGSPGPSSWFIEASRPSMETELWQGVQRSARRKDQENMYRTVRSETQAAWDAAYMATDTGELTALTVYQATAWAWGEGSGWSLPALRVRLDAVTAWWVAAATELKGGGGGGGFMVGGFISE